MVTSPPFHDSHLKGAAKETHLTLAVTAPLGANGDEDCWFCLGRDGRVQDEGRRSARSPGDRNDGSHAGNVASAGPPDGVVPPVIPAPGGVIVASVDGGRGRRSTAVAEVVALVAIFRSVPSTATVRRTPAGAPERLAALAWGIAGAAIQ